VAALALTGRAGAQEVRELFQRASRSVVVVRTLEKTLAPEAETGLTTAGGIGSGTVISFDGRILTAAHVVQTADRVRVELKDGRKYTARVVASSPRADVALLQMEHPPADLVPARLTDSDLLETGDQVVVIGAPYGLSYTLTVGHMSGRLRPKETVGGVPMEFIQTDAAINQGNSGGPMFNMKGEVVGVVSYILTNSGGFEGLGFAVSSNVAEKLLLSKASFWTGVEGILLSDDLARLFNLPQPAGVLIQRVAAGSPGAALGLRPGTIPVKVQDQELIVGGDIVLEIGDIVVSTNPKTEDQADQYLRAVPAGTPIRIKVLRGGKVVTLTAAKPR
jgi:S1-C subfamily serine protease